MSVDNIKGNRDTSTVNNPNNVINGGLSTNERLDDRGRDGGLGHTTTRHQNHTNCIKETNKFSNHSIAT